ncbi:guanylate kinase [Marinitoga hydrogenitolerans DSM 16785]|uniref:Guanylate kinase n=1 Tax=Marinitoga hydrogenitolerans (strain DSM 16785 / JCM 12826 / AT1271) TaxID=1122195 RepID=A0A1M4T1I3_MARH1|nr:guanylate kinase [Marinitoga hydrogenitolerans]SHE38338.1 guanylate kinase [Marinitoga hydrogenitolerans DSM 16785]
MTKGILYVVSGPSGVGKSSIIKSAMSKLEGFSFSVSYTTRPPRPGEVNGKDYFFVDEKTFNKMIENDEFLEYAKVHGHMYGTSKKYIKEKINEGMNIVLDIDVQGALNVVKKMPKETVLIFIAPPSYSELKKRLMNRGTEKKEDLIIRLNDAKWELSKINEFDYLIVNEELKEAINQLISIFIAEQIKTERVTEHLGRYSFFKIEEE